MNTETKLDLETAVVRFASVADKELLRWFPKPNSCIAAVRLATQVFEALGFQARAFSVVYQCASKSRHMLYVSGAAPEILAEADRAGSNVRRTQAGGWEGHLVCIVENRWWIDPTWQAALVHMGLADRPGTLVFRMPEGVVAEETEIAFESQLDSGETFDLRYTPAPDQGYRSAPAWELDHLEVPIEVMRRKILGVMTPDADPEQFVVYRRPRDYPDALFVVRRWQMIGSKILADRLPWSVHYKTENEAHALKTLRDELRAAGRYRLERFQMDDPAIVEVWI